MSFGRVLNVEIGVECQIFVIVIFFNCGQVLQFGAHSRYYKGALTQKRSFLVLCNTFRADFHVGRKNQNKHSTLNLSFDALSKWHDPHIKSTVCHLLQRISSEINNSIDFHVTAKRDNRKIWTWNSSLSLNVSSLPSLEKPNSIWISFFSVFLYVWFDFIRLKPCF